MRSSFSDTQELRRQWEEMAADNMAEMADNMAEIADTMADTMINITGDSGDYRDPGGDYSDYEDRIVNGYVATGD